MPNLIRHLFGYLPVNLVNGLVGFGSVFVFTRLLGGEDYGRYALALSSLHLIHTLTITWCEAAGYRFAGEAEARGTLANHFRTSLILGAISIIPALLVLGIVWFLVSSAPEYRSAILWLIILFPTSVIVNMALQSHKAGLRIKRYSAVETGRTLGAFVLGVGIAFVGGFGAAAPLIGMAIAFTITAVSEGLWLWRGSAGGKINAADTRKYLVYGLPVAAALVLDLILSASDRFLIALFIDEAAVGAYAAGYGVADKTVLMLCAWAAMAGAPLTMAAYEKEGPDGAKRAARGMMQSILLIAVPAAAGIALTAKPLSEVMIGEDLRVQAQEIIPWIAFAGLFNGLLIHYFSEAFQLSQKTLQRALIMIIPAALNIGLNIWLLPLIGVMGAVYATVICYALAMVLLALAGRRYLVMPVPFPDLVKVLAGCVAMAGAVQLIPSLHAFPELVLKAGIGALVYAVCVVSLNAAGSRSVAVRLFGKIKSRIISEKPA